MINTNIILESMTKAFSKINEVCKGIRLTESKFYHGPLALGFTKVKPILAMRFSLFFVGFTKVQASFTLGTQLLDLYRPWSYFPGGICFNLRQKLYNELLIQ